MIPCYWAPDHLFGVLYPNIDQVRSSVELLFCDKRRVNCYFGLMKAGYNGKVSNFCVIKRVHVVEDFQFRF
jgi:hypothetical protein